MKNIYFTLVFALFLCVNAISQSHYFGIYAEKPEVNAHWVINDQTTHLFYWENTVSPIGTVPAFGNAALGFKGNNRGWWGFGFHDDLGVNLTEFADGYLVFSVKTTTTKKFEILVASPNNREGKYAFIPGNDPDGFLRDGKWHTVQVPVKSLTAGATGLLLNQVSIPFSGVGDDATLEISFDEIYYYLPEKTTSINEKRVVSRGSIYPNPAIGNFTVTLTGEVESLTIINLSGKAVAAISDLANKLNITVSTAGWSKGLYFVVFMDAFGTKTTEKLIVK